MELLRGRDLRQLALSGAPLSLDRRLAVVLQVLAGLAHAHAAGVVHRDVKPANVFITEDGVREAARLRHRAPAAHQPRQQAATP